MSSRVSLKKSPKASLRFSTEGLRPQVVNVPMKPTGWLQVMCETCSKPTGAVGAPDVHVETRLKLESIEPPDPDTRSFSRCKNEGVSSRMGLHHAPDYSGLGGQRVTVRSPKPHSAAEVEAEGKRRE